MSKLTYDAQQNLKRETCRIIFVISTFATGDFPDSAQVNFIIIIITILLFG